MSKSQGEFLSTKKLCRALHSAMYLYCAPVAYLKGTATATTFTKIWENIRPDLRERVQGVKDTPILFKGAKICLCSALLCSTELHVNVLFFA